MTEYKYAEPENAAEALARIEHWMGNTGAFQKKLGLHDPGFGQEPYYHKFSAHHTENGRFDTMLAADLARYPDRWAEPESPVLPLKDSWQALLIRTRDEAQTKYAEYRKLGLDGFKTHVKSAVKAKVVVTKFRTKAAIAAKLGIQTAAKAPVIVSPAPWGSDPAPYDLATYVKVQKDIAAERAEAEKGVRPEGAPTWTRWFRRS